MPKSILQMAGAPTTPGALEDAVLVVVDAQFEYSVGRLPLSGIEAAVAEAARVLGLARKHGMPVFHIVHHGKPGSPLFDPIGPNSAILPPLAPRDGEEVIVKHLPNAFAGTTLDERIRATGRKELILVGFQTHMCISATARSALDHGYRTTVVAAACATRDLPNPLGGVTSAETLHTATLAALADRFAIVVRDSTALAPAG
jgi:nicotinamidase-related amidase